MATHDLPVEVLLAEGDADDAALISDALQHVVPRCRVQIVNDGQAALAYLRQQGQHGVVSRPHVLLMAADVPGTTAVDVLIELKSEPALRALPVVILGRTHDALDVRRAYDAHATGYFLKSSGECRVLIELVMRFVLAAERCDESPPPRLRDAESRLCGEQLRTAVMASPSGMVMVDAAGRIVLVNEELERMFGYAADELVGMPVDVLVPVSSRSDHERHRAQFVAAPVRRAMGAGRELYGIRKDGHEIPVEIGLNPIHTPDGLFTLSSIVDISARKLQHEALVQRTQELMRSNSELEQFAYVASHDLQEPLRMVSSYARLLADDYGDRLDEQGKLFLRYAQEGAERMQRLIRDLLAYSRIGSRPRQSRAVSMHACLEYALADLAISLEESKAQVRSDPLPHVLGDEGQLSELLRNLISNAIKFRTAADPVVEISAQQVPEGVQFRLRDNGIGIEPQYFHEVFQVFRRLHTADEYPGTGIGLAICKRIVERAGGRIWVEPSQAGGSTFCFVLPRATTVNLA